MLQHSPSRLIARHIFAILLAIVLASCSQDHTPTVNASTELDGQTAAIVNGDAIYQDDVELEAIAQGIIAPGQIFVTDHERYQNVLDQLIDQRLLAQEAIRRNLDLDKLARHRLAVARERILGNLLVESIVETDVTEEAIQQMYSEQTRLQQLDDEVRISLITVQDQATAEKVIQEYKGGTEFSALAFKYSTDATTRIQGGDIGYIAPAGQPEPFLSAIANTSVGSISSALRSDEGWHVMQVNDRRKPPPQTLEEMRPEITSFLTFAEINKIIRLLRTQAQIVATPAQAPAFSTTLPANPDPDPAEDSQAPQQTDQEGQ